MKQTHYKHLPLGLAALLFVITLMAVYPYYQYYIDPDAIAYLSVSESYAKGDYGRAINGYWSPLSCWLTAIGITQGLAPFLSAIVVNAIGALLFLWASHSLFIKFLEKMKTVFFLEITLSFFLVFAVFKQSFADLWGFAFLLLSLRILIRKDFLNHWGLWLLLGGCGALAYLSKAYALPYFVLEIIICVAVLIKQEKNFLDKKLWLKITAVTFLMMFLWSFPWMFLLHQKYGLWMTATSGSLNLSWYLLGHALYREGITLLLPPVYPDAIYFWEDPYGMNGTTPYFWDSISLFFLQIVRGGYNGLKLFRSMNELSAFFLPLSLVFIGIVFIKKIRRSFSPPWLIIAISFCLFPLGYMLINFESRYLWYLLPLSLLLVAKLWERYREKLPSTASVTLLTVICISYLVFPVWDMKTLFRKGEKEYQLAQRIKKAGIKGSFASNIPFNDKMQEVLRIAYFSGNPYYYMPEAPENFDALWQEMKRYKVAYYFQFQESFEQPFLTPPYGTSLVFSDTAIIGLKVYRLTE